ncbi:MAG TPA: bifunctional phosphopantothenoylcysteine decarboxylase/phosphopantothenate--cysteine ligase CoaBC [Gammaproteobacteria bacterium]|nr:bifunctional phosphopantothenoylcysteine decarboxylase/phosphopantothenate--cysteine ligase CoaBC [Gammaproteobacteria bacterium]
MNTLENKHIVLGVGGGIAAYKAADLVRRLIERGAEVRVVMTSAATQFVTPATFQALSHHPVATSLWDESPETGMGHLELAHWADFLLIAPATADLIARLSHGIADDLLTTLALACEAPLVLAPAMNHRMWLHPANQENVALLTARGARLLGPVTGALAERESGPGRMLEPVEIADALAGGGVLAGKRVLVTAGPTEEPIDPVRFIGNRSSGKMGYAVAAAAARAGAEVTLVSGPVALATPPGVQRIDVRTATAMLEAVEKEIDGTDLFIAAAAVADYAPREQAAQKIKKSSDKLTLELVRNPDILAKVTGRKRRPFCVGFAAETENVTDNARAKLEAKKLDLICANLVGDEHAFGRDDNALIAISADGENDLGRGSKRELAARLIELISHRLENKA